MSKLIIQGGKNTPNVILDPVNSTYKIFGKSFPENSKKFYLPIIDWVEKNSPSAGSSIDFNFYFYYLSSSSIVAVREILKRLAVWKQTGVNVNINWTFDEDDEEIKRIGEDYMQIVDFKFNFISTTDEE